MQAPIAGSFSLVSLLHHNRLRPLLQTDNNLNNPHLHLGPAAPPSSQANTTSLLCNLGLLHTHSFQQV